MGKNIHIWKKIFNNQKPFQLLSPPLSPLFFSERRVVPQPSEQTKPRFLRICIACLHSSQDNILRFSPNSFMIHLPFPCNSSLPDLWPSHLEEREAACVWLLPSSAPADGRAGETKVRLTLPTFLLGGYGWGCLFPAQPPFSMKKSRNLVSLRAFMCLSHWNEISQRDKCYVSITYRQRGSCCRNQSKIWKNWEAQLGKPLPLHKLSQSPNDCPEWVPGSDFSSLQHALSLQPTGTHLF